jgi:hypothetical protein
LGRLLTSTASSALALSAVAGGVMLFGGTAKAYTPWFKETSPDYTYRTSDAGPNTPSLVALGQPPQPVALGQFDHAWSPWLGDKRMKILNNGLVAGMTAGPNNVEWSYVPANPKPWHVDLDQAGVINVASSFLYRVQIDTSQDGLDICKTFKTCFPYFNEVNFGIQATTPSLPTKTIYQAIGDTKGAKLFELKNGETETFPIGVSDIIVEIEWGANNAVGDMFDNYNQVPGPLPILGASLALGSVRKLRNLTARLKVHSIG